MRRRPSQLALGLRVRRTAKLGHHHQAGLDGVRRRLEIETASPRSLPASLREALGILEESRAAGEWLGAEVRAAYLAFKRAEAFFEFLI